MLHESPTFESTIKYKRLQRLLFSDLSDLDPLRSRSQIVNMANVFLPKCSNSSKQGNSVFGLNCKRNFKNGDVQQPKVVFNE